MPVAPEDQGKDLLMKLLPNEWKGNKKIDRTELRNALLEAASLAFRLVVAEANAPCSTWTREKLNFVKAEDLGKLNRLPLARSLNEHSDGKLPSAIGFHVVDSEIGRYSQIWIPPSRACPGESEPRFGAWWKYYPELWLRVYKQFLHPSTSLINAYKRGLLKFPAGHSLLIHWGASDIADFRNDEVEVVSLLSQDNALNVFVEETQEVLLDFHALLLKYCLSGQPAKSEHIIVEEIGYELMNGEKQIVEMLRFVRDKYLVAVVDNEKHRKKFLAILKKLSTRDGSIISRLQKNKNIWLGEDRIAVMEGVEVLQTILFNAPGFCSKSGLLVDHKKYDNADVYLVMGREENFAPTFERWDKVRRIFRNHIVNGFESILDKKVKKSIRKLDGNSSAVVQEVTEYIDESKAVDVSGMNRFLEFALQLSREAIHEGQGLTFLLGYGHAEEPDVRCRKPIPIPRHLSREEVDLNTLVHFVKSYFSIFGRDDNLLWFDQKGRCCGLYERAPQDAKEKWLEGWDRQSYFVRIRGLREFDILEAGTTVFLKNQHRPRVRVKGDLVVDLKSTSDIQSRAFVAAAQVFNDNAKRAYMVSELVAKVADRLREHGHSGGLVIANRNPGSTNAGEWRSSIEEQVKSLVPKLYDEQPTKGEKVQFEGNLHLSDDLVNKICALAELDGAVYLSLEGEHICLAPARHFFPLITNKQKAGQLQENAVPNRLTQDFHLWAEQGKLKALESNVKPLRQFLEEWLVKMNQIGSLNLCERTYRKEFNKYKNMKVFPNMELIKLYAACLRGLPKLESDDHIKKVVEELAFLNSSGTRHHSLWGITLSSKERLFIVSLSQDGRVSIFWDGRLISSYNGSE